MFRKKFLTLSVLLLTIVLFATSCEVHEHVYNEDWKCNAFEHWQVCPEDGVKLERSKHGLDENNECTICGCLVVEFDDAIYIHCYDEYDNITRLASYDLDGSFLSETIFKNEYDENEDLVKVTTIIDGFVAEIEEFSTNEYGDVDSYLAVNTYYYEDGAKKVTKYNKHGKETSEITYDKDGNKMYEDTYEYIYETFVIDGEEEECLVCEKTYRDGTFYKETSYDFENFIITITVYNEDSTKTISRYDIWGELIDEETVAQ